MACTVDTCGTIDAHHVILWGQLSSSNCVLIKETECHGLEVLIMARDDSLGCIVSPLFALTFGACIVGFLANPATLALLAIWTE